MSSTPADGGRMIVRRAPRWMWVALILSLSINLLILGIVIGTKWAVRERGYWDAPLVFERTQRFMGTLPTERRRELRGIFFEHKPRLEPYWAALRQARIRIGQLIASGNYAQEDLDKAMDELFQKELAARAAAKPMIAAMIARLQPGERKDFLSVFMPDLGEAQGRLNSSASP
jgi:uncharacterized membrane protein